MDHSLEYHCHDLIRNQYAFSKVGQKTSKWVWQQYMRCTEQTVQLLGPGTAHSHCKYSGHHTGSVLVKPATLLEAYVADHKPQTIEAIIKHSQLISHSGPRSGGPSVTSPTE